MTPASPDEKQTSAFAAGAVVGAYRIDSEIGRGGMGVVYKAIHTVLNKPVAIKVMGVAFSANEQAIARLMAEGRALAKLQHPNVVSITDCGEFSGLPYLVLEFLEGGTVEGWLQRSAGRLPTADVHRILMDALAGLQAAHDAQIIHRDLKPSNFLIDGQGRIRISDFGLAQAFQGGDVTVVDRTIFASSPTVTSFGPSRSSSTGPVGGTVQFMAPELHGGSQGDARSDIFAIGVMTYYLLTGRKPAGKFVEASKLLPGLPRSWDAFIDKCIAQQPDDRFQSAAAALAALPAAGRRTGVRRWTVVAAVVLTVGLGLAAWGLLGRQGSGGGVSNSRPMNASVHFSGFALGDQVIIDGGQTILVTPRNIQGADRTLATRKTRVKALRGGSILFEREFDFSNEDQWVVDLGVVVSGNRSYSATGNEKPATAVPPLASAAASDVGDAQPAAIGCQLEVRFDGLPLPADAELLIDGLRGVVPDRDDRRAVVSLAPGSHVVELRGKGLRPVSATVETVERQPAVVHLDVAYLEYCLTLNELPVGASGTIDTRPFTATAGAATRVNVPYGRHTLVIEAPLREPYRQEIDVSAEATLSPVMGWRSQLSLPLPDGSIIAVRRLEAGDYHVGSRASDPRRQITDLRERTVRLAGCYMALTELTRGQYAAILRAEMVDTGSAARIAGIGLPVANISGRDLLSPTGLLAQLNRHLAAVQPEFVADLPTEEEWEAVCLARDAGSDLGEAVLPVAVAGDLGPVAVAGLAANRWGFRGMLGNVAELTRPAAESGIEPAARLLVLRGGSWQSGPAGQRPQARLEVADNLRLPNAGLRLVFRCRSAAPVGATPAVK